jgi:hypothetical protein
MGELDIRSEEAAQGYEPGDTDDVLTEYDDDAATAGSGHDGITATDSEESDIDDDLPETVTLAPSTYSSAELGASFALRAAADGVQFPEGMARRAGEIMSRERIVDPRAAAGIVDSHGGLQNLARMAMLEEPDETDLAEESAGPTRSPAMDMALEAEVPVPADAVAEPEAPSRPAEASDSVGRALSSIWSGSGVSLHDLAEQVGEPPEILEDMFNGTVHPDISKVLIPVLQRLGVGPDTGLALIDRYRAEQGYPLPT